MFSCQFGVCVDGGIEVPKIFETETLESEGAESAQKREIFARTTKGFD